MNLIPTAIPGVVILEPKVFGDDRGFFLESYNERALRSLGIDATFVQDNHSRSACNVLRGLHYQVAQTQGKLVRAVRGRVFDVAVDMRAAALCGRGRIARSSGKEATGRDRGSQIPPSPTESAG